MISLLGLGSSRLTEAMAADNWKKSGESERRKKQLLVKPTINHDRHDFWILMITQLLSVGRCIAVEPVPGLAALVPPVGASLLSGTEIRSLPIII